LRPGYVDIFTPSSERKSERATVSVNSMIAFVIENSKLIMIFLLIGIIIALGSRPYRHETRE
jgi:hypothetical protein